MIPDTFARIFAGELRDSLVCGNEGKFPMSSGIWAGPWTEQNLNKEGSKRSRKESWVVLLGMVRALSPAWHLAHLHPKLWFIKDIFYANSYSNHAF